MGERHPFRIDWRFTLNPSFLLAPIKRALAWELAFVPQLEAAGGAMPCSPNAHYGSKSHSWTGFGV